MERSWEGEMQIVFYILKFYMYDYVCPFQGRIKLTVGPTPPTVLGSPPRGVTRWVGGE